MKKVVFSRGLIDKSQAEKRKLLQKIKSFKQSFSTDEMQILKDRQFVIVDQAQMMRCKKRRKPQQVQMEKMNHLELNSSFAKKPERSGWFIP